MRIELFGAVFGLSLALSSAASAGVTSGLPSGGVFVEKTPVTNPGGPGNYGVELRYGDSAGNATWEIGVGQGTSQPGNFNQANFDWGNAAIYNYMLTWDSLGISFTLGGTTVSYAAPLVGNTLNIYAKGVASITFPFVDGTPFGGTLTGPSNDQFFYSDNNWGGNGLIVTGTLSVGDGGMTNCSGSRCGLQFKVGTTTVPEPATIALLTAALVGIAAVRRRGRTV